MKIETESEALIRSKIGDKVAGSSVDPSLEGYELEITGTSDSSGFPGIKGQVGTQLRGVLLTRNQTGMKNERKGLRLKKSVRGEEISEKTVQINIKVLREGSKKFDTLIAKPAEGESKEGEAPKEEGKEKKEEAPSEETKEAAPAEEEPKQDKPTEEQANPEEEPKQETPTQEGSNPEEEPKSS